VLIAPRAPATASSSSESRTAGLLTCLTQRSSVVDEAGRQHGGGRIGDLDGRESAVEVEMEHQGVQRWDPVGFIVFTEHNRVTY
jgi:hypothetical protein